MIKSLRRNFILVAMCSTFAVLLVMIGSILVFQYVNITKRADRLLEILAQNDGKFPRELETERARNKEPIPRQEPPEEGLQSFGRKEMSPETPFETRFFYVELDGEGQTLAIDTGNVAAVEDEEAEDYAQIIWESGKKKGFYHCYRYLMEEKEEVLRIIFVDCTRDLDSYQNILFLSVSISLFGLFLVFILVLIFSKVVFRPVAEGYEKQKRFITDASHELKTPLTIIDANTEVLEMMQGENEWTESTKNQVRRLTALTQQMVMLTKMDEEIQTGVMTVFSLSDAVAEEAERFCPVAEARGKTALLQLEPDISYKGEEDMIRRLVVLLLDNAVKYSNKKQAIQVKLYKKGKKAVLCVTNGVDSISQGNLDILFERFYRTDASRNSQTGGSGIGLSIAHAIVQSHRGKITAYSPDGKSIIITVIL